VVVCTQANTYAHTHRNRKRAYCVPGGMVSEVGNNSSLWQTADKSRQEQTRADKSRQEQTRADKSRQEQTRADKGVLCAGRHGLGGREQLFTVGVLACPIEGKLGISPLFRLGMDLR
jgi:hypothetical protein